jgi:hypothetical protein
LLGYDAWMHRPLIAAFLAAHIVWPAFAQQPARISPHETVTGRIGDATLTITYGRPSIRGRAIFGALVPYGRVWCPGADEATTLESDRPMQIGTLRVPAGPHTIWMLPTPREWTLVVSKEPSGFHTQYHRRADLGRVPLTKSQLDPPAERLTFAISATGGDAGVVEMTWETTKVSVPVRVAR